MPQSHPWLNDRAVALVDAKGTQTFIHAVVEEGERSHGERDPGQQHLSSQDQRRCLGTGCAGQSEPVS